MLNAKTHTIDLHATTQVLIRWCLTVIGVLFLVIGVVGIYLPGIPTTGPVLLSIYLFSKACPQFNQTLRQSKLIRSYFNYYESPSGLSLKTKCYAISCMWVSITASCLYLSYMTSNSWHSTRACCLGGLIGTIVILRFRTGD